MNIKRIIQVAHTKLKVHRWIAWLLCAALIGGMVNSALPARAVNENDIDNIIDDIDITDDIDSTDDVDSTDDIDGIDSEDTYCEHHPEHTEDCGYVEAVEGQPCTHEHDEECGYAEAAECTHEHGDCGYAEEQPCTHEHNEECGYDEDSETPECTHEHDDDCGYVEGQPCTHGHDDDCGYSEAAECTHEHDDTCGYVEAVEGQPCQFVCEICTDEPKQIATMAAAEPLWLGLDDGLIAHFTFDNDNKLEDSSGKSVGAKLYEAEGGVAELKGRINSTDDKWNSYFTSENDRQVLKLDGDACLALDANTVEDWGKLTEMTVEMTIKVEDYDQSNYWLFYAAPDNSSANGTYKYLGITLMDRGQTLRTARYTPNSSSADYKQGAVEASNPYADNGWHTISVVYKKNSSTALYIDGEKLNEQGLPNRLADYFGGDGTVVWFGHSAWPGDDNPNFKGCIDEIRIYDYAVLDDTFLTDEEQHIITERVVDPDNTTVNMFDYWITGQTDNDYRTSSGQTKFLTSGINKDHLFLFAGSDADTDSFAGSREVLGDWNAYFGDPQREGVMSGDKFHYWYEPYSGIVGNVLGDDGYPYLAIDQLLGKNVNEPTAEELKSIINDEKHQTESLDYLFDLKDSDSKAVYPNVTGLFRLDNDGYYYFRSGETFAELNRDQGDRPKKSKESTEGNHITLYDEIWDSNFGGSGDPLGQFFPFNDWSDLFRLNEEGELEQINGMGVQSTTDEPLNHYLGMTVETEFQQPTNGEFNRGSDDPLPMTFEFSGDDDVWLFIDDMLVGDLGGLHMRVKLEIDFSTGIVNLTGDLGETTGSEQQLTDFDTTLHAVFGNTIDWNIVNKDGEDYYLFPDGSTHTLKFFYLERGNAASNCSIRFNLMEPPTDRIRKTDENGDPLADATFELYKAEHNDNDTGTVDMDKGEWWHTADEFKVVGGSLATITSSSDGYAELTDNKGGPINFVDGKFYILKETDTPSGYRTNPDIVLQFHGGANNTFIVVNKYETGAYASFAAHWTHHNMGEVYYAKYTPDGLMPDNNISDGDLKNGLSIMVPIYKLNDGSWVPAYGSNTYGWHVITDSYQAKQDQTNPKTVNFVKDVALAAILQIADEDSQDWYLNYVEGAEYLDAYMENLPADATRYVDDGVEAEAGDLCLVTLFLPKNVLSNWDVTGESDDARYKNLQRVLSGINTEEAARIFLENHYTPTEELNGDDTLGLLYNSKFRRENRSVIYIPNEQRELRVRKTVTVDSDDSDDSDDSEVIYVNGAVFAIFDTLDAAAEYKTEAADADGAMAALKGNSNVLSCGVTSTVTPGTQAEEGLLIFREKVPTEDGYGYAKIAWPSTRTDTDTNNVLWLKEVYAPDGYDLNENLIRIEVGNMAIYANATGYDSNGNYLSEGTDDGITVEASLGKLSQTLVKYALGNKVEVTLQDITITKQTAANVGDNGALLDAADWRDESDTYDLHYGINADALPSQYGLHYSDYESGVIPVFTADDGYIRVMPRQNQEEYEEDGVHEPGVRKVSLLGPDKKPIDLGNLFGLINVVVVEDKPVDTPTEQPPKKNKPSNPPAEQPSEEYEPMNLSAQQPPKKEEEPKTTGVLASPQTGDNSMVVLWLTLLVLSISGITALTKVYYTRKRGDKEQST